MLQSMREMSKTWLFKGLMAMLVLSFGVWGIGDMFRTHPGQREVAQIGKVKILAQELLMQFQLSLPEAKKVFGQDLTIAQAKKLGVLDRTLSVLVEQAAFDQETNRLGLKLDDQTVMKRIATLPQLQDKDGRFDVAAWQRLIGKSGLSERVFVEHEKGELQRDLLFRAVIANAEPPKLLIDNLYRALGTKRLLEVVTLRNDSLHTIPAPSAEDLQAFYDAHQENFTAPEYRGVTVARLMADDVAKDIAVTDDELRKAYDERGAELTLPERRDLSQIVFQDEAKAKTFHDSVLASSSLADAAKAKGLTAVTLSKVDEKSVLPELYTAVFAVGEGETTEPVKTSLGWHVIQVKKIYPPGKPAFDQVKEELRQTLKDERLGDMMSRDVNQLDDAIAAGKPLEDIADALKLRLVRFPAVDAQGKSPDGKDVAEIPFKKEVLASMLDLGAGETSQVMDDHQGNYFVVRTDEISPSRVLPLEDVMARVKAGWLAQKQAEAAKVAAEEMAETLRQGGKATSFAARPGVEVRLSKPLSMLGDMDRDLPPGAIGDIFKMKKGDVIVASTPDKAYVLRLVDTVPVDPAKPEASRMRVVAQLEDQLRFDLLDQYATRLKALFPRKINQAVLDSLKNQESEDLR